MGVGDKTFFSSFSFSLISSVLTENKSMSITLLIRFSVLYKQSPRDVKYRYRAEKHSLSMLQMFLPIKDFDLRFRIGFL